MDPLQLRFLEDVAEMRAELHRYCARMMGSVIEGEDVVQETLLRAYDGLGGLRDPARMRPWLFRMAHNRALDRLRSYERRMVESMDAAREAFAFATPAASDDTPEARIEQAQAVHAALMQFVGLPPAQRSAIILKDVLEHSLQEIAELLQMSVPAVQAALHRGRTALRIPSARAVVPKPRGPVSVALQRYAEAFNARDWDSVRAMLADDVRLDVVSRFRRRGREAAGNYYTNYASLGAVVVVPGWLDGAEVLGVFDDAGAAGPHYFIALAFDRDRVAWIHDYRHVPYIAREAQFERASE